MTKRFLQWTGITAAAVMFSCSQIKNSEYLPVASGKPGDVIVMMDSVQWKGELGDELRKIFKAEVPGLPRDEPMFNLIHVHPRINNTLLIQIRNLVMVFTLEPDTPGSRLLRERFNKETLNRIATDTSFFLFTEKDEFARGQEVMYLFAANEEQLIRKLRENRQNIQNFFNDLEKRRMVQNILSTTTTKGITEMLKRQYGFEIRVPFGFKVADTQDDFVWLRQMDAQVDKNVFISWKPYVSEYQLLPDSIIAWRDEITRKYIFEDPDDPQSFLLTETTVPFKPVKARQTSINKAYAMELRGLWRTNNRTMGGPFISYAVVSQGSDKIYYLEGFCFSPGKDQRETIRELEAILSTFRMTTIP
jgi:hypothetical protein